MKAGQKMNLHYCIAEQGKLYALKGNHKEALRYFKEALRMCQGEPGADIFFQHYSLCAMESLELMQHYNEVIDFCDKCLDFLVTKTEMEELPVFQKLKASLLERKGIQYLHLNDKQEAVVSFKQALQIMDKKHLPLSNELLNWVLRGYSISSRQIFDLQNRHHYFTVRKDNVDEKIAMELPEIIHPF